MVVEVCAAGEGVGSLVGAFRAGRRGDEGGREARAGDDEEERRGMDAGRDAGGMREGWTRWGWRDGDGLTRREDDNDDDAGKTTRTGEEAMRTPGAGNQTRRRRRARVRVVGEEEERERGREREEIKKKEEVGSGGGEERERARGRNEVVMGRRRVVEWWSGGGRG